jgi:hypothetical protein
MFGKVKATNPSYGKVPQYILERQKLKNAEEELKYICF